MLATDFRMATPNTRIGLPETKLGIMPGFGGRVRLPRLLGADSALEIIAAGKDIDGAEALKLGLVDAVVSSRKTTQRSAKHTKRGDSGKTGLAGTPRAEAGTAEAEQNRSGNELQHGQKDGEANRRETLSGANHRGENHRSGSGDRP